MLNLNPYEPHIADERRLRLDVERHREARERRAARAEAATTRVSGQPAPESTRRRILFRLRRA